MRIFGVNVKFKIFKAYYKRAPIVSFMRYEHKIPKRKLFFKAYVVCFPKED